MVVNRSQTQVLPLRAHAGQRSRLGLVREVMILSTLASDCQLEMYLSIA